jgi:acyl-coenzyme A synthetase/AMP-(fatty) acid ligase
MNLISGFVKQSLAHPQRTALMQGERQLSYAELFQKSICVAAFLQSRNVVNHRIAIAMERGTDACIAIFGILYSGNCYVPLDIKNPSHRLEFIVNDADVAYILGQGSSPEWLSNAGKWQDIEALFNLVSGAEEFAELDAESLAAILYTSGSTGVPKGVALSHRAILNFTQWAEVTFRIDATHCVASLAPFHFDLSTFDLFCSLSAGAMVHFVPEKLTFSPSRLSAWLAENEITTWYTVPSILCFLTLKGALKTTSLAKLKTVLFAGEVFPVEHLITLTAYLPHVDFYNLFGPTETNVCCYWPVDRKRLEKDIAIPIGISACNSQLSIDAQSGELRVASRNNFSGYWQQGKLVAFNDEIYKTGDKVTINALAEFCFHGRLSRMLKCSGYRVEPAEIEQIINSISVVIECVVFGVEDLTSGQRPAAAIVLQPGFELADIIKPIRESLPAYMHPCKYLKLQKLPYLSNGKIDMMQLQRTITNQ